MLKDDCDAWAAVRTFLCGAALLFLLNTHADAQPISTSKSQTLSGYGPASSLESGDSVTEDLSIDDQRADGVLSFPKVERFFSPWFEWKRRVNDKYGLQLQFSIQSLHQEVNRTLGEHSAAGARM